MIPSLSHGHHQLLHQPEPPGHSAGTVTVTRRRSFSRRAQATGTTFQVTGWAPSPPAGAARARGSSKSRSVSQAAQADRDCRAARLTGECGSGYFLGFFFWNSTHQMHWHDCGKCTAFKFWLPVRSRTYLSKCTKCTHNMTSSNDLTVPTVTVTLPAPPFPPGKVVVEVPLGVT